MKNGSEIIQKLFRTFSCRMLAALGDKSKDAMVFSKYILFSRQSKTVF